MLNFRNARREDVPVLVSMLADDPLGATREAATNPLPDGYYAAFAAIDADPHNSVLVAEDESGIAGFLQLTLIPYLTYQGGWRALIEGVRVRSGSRGQGIGAALLEHAIDVARQRACHLVQLTTDKQRPDALRFYAELGFQASHEGLKLHLR